MRWYAQDSRYVLEQNEYTRKRTLRKEVLFFLKLVTLWKYFAHNPILVAIKAVDIKAFHIGYRCIVCCDLGSTGFVFRLCFYLRSEVRTVEIIADAVRSQDFEALFVFHSRLGERACLPERAKIKVPVSQLQSQCRQDDYHQYKQQPFHFTSDEIHPQENEQ